MTGLSRLASLPVAIALAFALAGAANAQADAVHYRVQAEATDDRLAARADPDNPQRSPALRNLWFAFKDEQALVLPKGRVQAAATLELDDVPSGPGDAAATRAGVRGDAGQALQQGHAHALSDGAKPPASAVAGLTCAATDSSTSCSTRGWARSCRRRRSA